MSLLLHFLTEIKKVSGTGFLQQALDISKIPVVPKNDFERVTELAEAKEELNSTIERHLNDQKKAVELEHK